MLGFIFFLPNISTFNAIAHGAFSVFNSVIAGRAESSLARCHSPLESTVVASVCDCQGSQIYRVRRARLW